MKSLTKVSVLGIGTELTSGQILNRNAQWISRKLTELGFETTTHLVVPDDKPLMMASFHFCQQRSDIVFITGGLGPTTDDFTRDVISELVQKPLIFDEGSWQHIVDRLNSRGVPVREAQRQQCYFPEGSEILKNVMGTANAFRLTHNEKIIYVLPGPPREIDSVWKDHIAEPMKQLSKNFDQKITLIWNNLGLGESEIAHLTEQALQDCHLEKGYRAHHPYVEVKLSYKKSEEKEALLWAVKVTKALAPYTVTRDDHDIAEILSAQLEKFSSIAVVDEVTGSHLLGRLVPVSKNLLNTKKLSYVSGVQNSVNSELVLKLEKISTESVEASLIYKNETFKEILKSPYKGLLVAEREALFYAERALFFWARQLNSI